jgi:hypothetical protein
MSLTIFNHLQHFCSRQGGSRVSWFMPLSIIFSLLPHLCGRKGDQETNVLCHLQYSVIYHTFDLGRGVQGSHGLCHFQYFYSHVPHLCYRQGVQEAHVFCHFQYCFSQLPHICYRQGGSGCSCLLPLFNNVSVLYHTCVVVRVFRRLMCYATYNI